MDLAQIQELLNIVAESGVAEVEIEEDDFRLVVRKSAPNITMQQQPQGVPFYGMNYGPPQMPPQQAPAPPPQQPAGAQQPAQAAPSPQPKPAEAAPASSEEEVKAAEDEKVVRAPIVGTFYRAPAPDEAPFVEEGDEVKPGDVLCIIEAMKLMNEIECEVAGTIKQIFNEDAQPVEYDQPLFVIETT